MRAREKQTTTIACLCIEEMVQIFLSCVFCCVDSKIIILMPIEMCESAVWLFLFFVFIFSFRASISQSINQSVNLLPIHCRCELCSIFQTQIELNSSLWMIFNSNNANNVLARCVLHAHIRNKVTIVNAQRWWCSVNICKIDSRHSDRVSCR